MILEWLRRATKRGMDCLTFHSPPPQTGASALWSARAKIGKSFKSVNKETKKVADLSWNALDYLELISNLYYVNESTE